MNTKQRHILILFFLFSFLSIANSNLPTADDINAITLKANEIINRFWLDSFELRMHYEFAGKILKENDRLKLSELSENAAHDIDKIIQKQQKLNELIENYEGDDWEKRYGQTDLWRRLDYSYLKAKSDQCLIDSYRTLSTEASQRDEIIKQVILRVKEIKHSFISKARALALIAVLKPEYKEAALKELGYFIFYSDIYRPIAAKIEEIKLQNSADPCEIRAQIETIEKYYSGDYKELLIQLIILQRKHDFDSYIKTIGRYPGIKSFFCQLISHSILNDPDFEIKIKEAEMLAEFSLLTNPQKYQNVLKQLQQNDDFNSSLIDFAAAMAILDLDKPKAVKLMVKASQSHNKKPNPFIKIDAVEIARQAAISGYDLYLKDHNYVEASASAFYNYRKLAGEKIDEDIQWQFVLMHINDFDAATGYSMLRDIQKRRGKYSKRATLFLAAEQVRKGVFKEVKQRQYLLQQFAELLVSNYDCFFYREAYGLVEDTLLQIELYTEDANMISNCRKIAEFINQCDDQPQTKLLLAETILLCPENKQIEQAQNLIRQAEQKDKTENLQLIRCQARLNQEADRLGKAALLWGKIAASLDKAKDNKTINWLWWRAKYYQFECAYKAGENPEDISHVIDVLTATHTDIPAPWAAKLGELQQKVSKN